MNAEKMSAFISDRKFELAEHKAMMSISMTGYLTAGIRAADSLAMLADYLANGIKTVSVGKRPF